MTGGAGPAGICDHIGILTGNADVLLRFYRDVLGFEIVKDEIVDSDLMDSIFGEPGDCRLIKLSHPSGKDGAVNIEIFAFKDHAAGRRRPRSPGYNHWGFRVGDRRAYIARMKKLGVAVTDVLRGKHHVYFICDPDGNRIEIRD